MSGDGSESTTWALRVAYDGAPFSGFARQEGQDTVQGRIESAVSTALRHDVEVVGAGRTDTGVHALGQVVSFTTEADVPDAEMLRRSLNALVGEGIAVTELRRARPGFSARFDAVSREYRYRIVASPVQPLFLAGLAWWTNAWLDVPAMAEAALPLVGEHDFRSFCVTSSAEGVSTTRAVERVWIEPAVELGEHCLVVGVVGNAFLHSMVRVIVGTLVEVGRGARRPDWVAEVLEARDRRAAGPTAPAHGLTLWRVDYPDEAFES
jgi:tRNA pseudouridine38-40 synthase